MNYLLFIFLGAIASGLLFLVFVLAYGLRRKSKCHEGIHLFEGRYDYGVSDDRLAQILRDIPHNAYEASVRRERLIKQVTKKMYVHDVCIYCGKTIERLVPDRLDIPVA